MRDHIGARHGSQTRISLLAEAEELIGESPFQAAPQSLLHLERRIVRLQFYRGCPVELEE